MFIVIHLVGGRVIELKDRVFNQENVEGLYEMVSNLGATFHYVETNGKNYIIPVDKILFIETKINS
jgi:hypothetical protein